MSDNVRDIEIKQGKTFSLLLLWQREPIIRKAITGISYASGAPRLTVIGHGCPDGFDAAVTLVKAPKQINAANTPPRDSDYHKVTVIDANTVEFNEVDPVDHNGNEWPAYTSGGFLQYFTPVDLTGYTARMAIKDKKGGTVLMSLTTENGRIAIDEAAHTVTMSITAEDTADIDWKKGVYDLEMVSPTGVVTSPLTGDVSVVREVTTA